jgi:hypothetical protein
MALPSILAHNFGYNFTNKLLGVTRKRLPSCIRNQSYYECLNLTVLYTPYFSSIMEAAS